jgi:hypothetical protein
MGEGTTISPLTTGICAAIAGAGLGAFWAPRRHSLEDLITLEHGKYEKIFSPSTTRFATKSQKLAWQKINEARDTFKKSSEAGIGDGEIAKLLRNDDLKHYYEFIKGWIPKSRVFGAIAGALILGVGAMVLNVIFCAPPKKNLQPN